MSGGGMGGAGSFSDAGYANRRATGYTTAGMRRSRMNQTNRVAANAARSPGGAGLGTSAANGAPRVAAAGVEPVAKPKPQSKGPSGIDTGGSGTDTGDPQSILARAEQARRRRLATARGGGLSNVRLGSEMLGG